MRRLHQQGEIRETQFNQYSRRKMTAAVQKMSISVCNGINLGPSLCTADCFLVSSVGSRIRGS